MRAGTLRHRMLLQRPDFEQNSETGMLTTVWIDVCKLWAEIVPLSAREFIAAQSMQSDISARIVIRYRADIDATMRLLHDGKIYNIKGVLTDPVSGREYITLPCSEGINEG